MSLKILLFVFFVAPAPGMAREVAPGLSGTRFLSQSEQARINFFEEANHGSC